MSFNYDSWLADQAVTRQESIMTDRLAEVNDIYGVSHTQDFLGNQLETGKQYYLIEYGKEHFDIASEDDIRNYLDLSSFASDEIVCEELDRRYPGWSLESAE